MIDRIKIKSKNGWLYSSEITTGSGEQIPRVSDFKIEVKKGRVYAILTILDPILDIETENCEVINESRNDPV